MTLLERFEAKYIPEPNSGCWLWTAQVDSKGYGRFFIGNRLRLAHRASFELFKGPIEGEGTCVLHRCDVPPCVNPGHLFLGTNKDNSEDCRRKGRVAKFYGEANPNAKLTADQVSAIRAERAAGFLCRDVAARYGVSEVAVWGITSGRYWTLAPWRAEGST